jgi:hypothetical protein
MVGTAKFTDATPKTNIVIIKFAKLIGFAAIDPIQGYVYFRETFAIGDSDHFRIAICGMSSELLSMQGIA